MKVALLAATAAGCGIACSVAMATPQAANSLTIVVDGAKSDKGVIRLALCPPQAGFPKCTGALTHTATLKIVRGTAQTVLTGLPPGTYAVSVFHDANDNGKLDTFVGIPKEGYGFSRNPGFKPRAPTFDETEIRVDGNAATTIKLRYLL